MDIKVFSKNLEWNSEAEKYVQKKFRRLERHLRPVSDAKLEVSRTSARSQTERVVVQMTLTAGGFTLRGQESGINLFAAVDAVTDVIDRQIQRYKGKVYRSEQARRSSRAGGPPAGAFPTDTEIEDEAEEDEFGESGHVVRTKRFPIKPMTVEDAILQMELLSHDFFLFYNADADEYNVAYRRHDGGYGVIEPYLS